MPWKRHIGLTAALAAALIALPALAQTQPRQCTREDYAKRYDIQKLLWHLASPARKADGQAVNITATHRGDWRYHPDNSLSGFQSAYDRGDEVLEVDVRVSADDQLYMIHDDILNRVTTIPPEGNRAVNIRDVQSTILDNAYLRMRDGTPTTERMLRFEDFLKWYYTKALCKGANGETVGTLIILDIKGNSQSNWRGEVEQWYVLKQVAAAIDILFHKTANWGWPIRHGIVYKAHLIAMPKDDQTFEIGTRFDGNQPVKDWNQNMIFVVNPENEPPSKNPGYTTYKDKDYTIAFEVNRRHRGDRVDKEWIPELLKWVPPASWKIPDSRKGRSIHDFLDDNNYPEGRATAGQCCGVTPTPEWDKPRQGKQEEKGYIQFFFLLSNLMTIDDPEFANAAFAVRKRDMSLFKAKEGDQ